jgi:hypothetical protein
MGWDEVSGLEVGKSFWSCGFRFRKAEPVHCNFSVCKRGPTHQISRELQEGRGIESLLK